MKFTLLFALIFNLQSCSKFKRIDYDDKITKSELNELLELETLKVADQGELYGGYQVQRQQALAHP